MVASPRRAEFRVVAIAHAPDQVFASRPGVPLPDDRGQAVIWAPHGAVARAFDMEGALNDLSARLAPGGSERAVLAARDRLLEPHGGAGAVGRAEHPSRQFLQDELAEQRTSAVVLPLIFLGVAAFLPNTVLGRLVEAQRGQVAALKAMGFPSWPIVAHYGKLAAAVCLAGAVLGLAAIERVHAAEHEREQARILLRHCKAPGTGAERWPIEAPVSGRVLRVHQRCAGPVVTGAARRSPRASGSWSRGPSRRSRPSASGSSASGW